MTTIQKSPELKTKRKYFTYKEYLETFLHINNSEKDQFDEKPYELGAHLAAQAIKDLRQSIKKTV